MSPLDLKKLLELDQLAQQDGLRYIQKRELYYSLHKERAGRHFLAILGPRGVGKTILLKQIRLDTPASLYVSLDTLRETDLFALAKEASERYRIKTLMLDEVHFIPGFERYLKQIYDFLDVRVIFTSSVSISILKSSHDLARRVQIHTLYSFTFRQFLAFKNHLALPPLSLDQLFGPKCDSELLKIEYLFDAYLKGGLLPFSLEEPEVLPLLGNVLEKILTQDIPSVAKLTLDEVYTLKKMVKFIALSEVDGINYSSLSHNLGITKYKAEQYLDLLEKSFVIIRVMPKGTNVLREPKVVMYLPYRLLFRPFETSLDALREDFFVQMARTFGLEFYYLKSNRGMKTPDYLVVCQDRHYIVEVGGKGKGRTQFKGISAYPKVILSHGSDKPRREKKPLFFWGLLSF
jgi:predicted AAA+ superfamily ATPase